MSKLPYLPSDDARKKAWLINYSSKFPTYSTLFGFTAADVTAVSNQAAMYSFLMDSIEKVNTAKEAFVEYKNLIKSGKIGSPTGAFPSLPVLPR